MDDLNSKLAALKACIERGYTNLETKIEMLSIKYRMNEEYNEINVMIFNYGDGNAGKALKEIKKLPYAKKRYFELLDELKNTKKLYTKFIQDHNDKTWLPMFADDYISKSEDDGTETK